MLDNKRTHSRLPPFNDGPAEEVGEQPVQIGLGLDRGARLGGRRVASHGRGWYE